MREVVGRVGFRWALAAVTAVVLAGCSSGLSGLLGTTLQTAEPTFSLEPGEYPRDIQVELASETEGAVIYYTTDGSEAAVSWELYGGPFEVAGHGTQIDVRAYADAEGRQPSGEVLGEFSIAYPLVTLESAGNGTVAFVDGGGTGPRAVEAGTSVEITASAESGFQFGGWTVTNGDPQTVAIAEPTAAATQVTLGGEDVTVSASFVDEDAPNAPEVSGPAATNNPRPTWSWTSGGGGNGTFRYKLNNADLTSDATVTTATSFAPGSDLNDDQHTLYVQEQDDGGTWSPAGSATVTVDTLPPDQPTIEGVGDGFASGSVAFTVEWAETGGTQEYRLTSGGNWQTYTGGPVTISIEGDYQISARQTDAAGNVSDLAPTVSGTIMPVAPSGLTATAQNADRIDLSWQDNSNTEDGYEVQRKEGSGGTYAQVATLSADTTDYHDTALDSQTTYYYRVRATNSAGASNWSNEANDMTAQLAAPSGLTATAVSQTQIDLNWSDNSNYESGFEIERDGEIIDTVAAGSTSYSDTGLSFSTQYTYRLRAADDGGASAWSDGDSATTPEYDIGDTGPAGGIIFYDDLDDGQDDITGARYLEAAPNDIDVSGDYAHVWGGYETEVGSSAQGTAIGTGEDNTAAIVAAYGASDPYDSTGDYAARLADQYAYEGYNDWFLPSKDELDLMHQNKETIGGFESVDYWSSSENGANVAWHQYFGDGLLQSAGGKFGNWRVRAVRAF